MKKTRFGLSSYQCADDGSKTIGFTMQICSRSLKFWIATLIKKFKDLCIEKHEFQQQSKTPAFWNFGPSVFQCKYQTHDISQPIPFHKERFRFETFIERIEPVVTQNYELERRDALL